MWNRKITKCADRCYFCVGLLMSVVCEACYAKTSSSDMDLPNGFMYHKLVIYQSHQNQIFTLDTIPSIEGYVR